MVRQKISFVLMFLMIIEEEIIPQVESLVLQERPSPDFSVEIPNYPFLIDKNSKLYIKSSKVFFLVNDLAGEDSDLSKWIYEAYPDSIVCFDDGHEKIKLTWDSNEEDSSLSYSECKEEVKIACVENVNTIIVSNHKDVSKWQKKYISLAKNYGYIVILVEPLVDINFNSRLLSLDIDTDLISNHVDDHQIKPLYFGWFVNNIEGEILKDVVMDAFKACMTHVASFRKYIEFHFSSDPEKEVHFEDVYSQYVDFKNLHVTSFFANNGASPGYEKYVNKKEVKNSIGKYFELEIIGILLTPRTTGARIRLNNEELLVWNSDDFENSTLTPNCSLQSSLLNSWTITNDELLSENSANSSCLTSNFHPTCGLGSRAHITLGLTHSSKAVQTGLDLIDIINCEEKLLKNETHTEFSEGSIRYYGSGRAMLYLKNSIFVPALFHAHY